MVTIVFTVMALAALAFGVLALRYRGKRIVECPETLQPVCTEIGALRAAAGKLTGGEKVVISSCSRWPEKEDCDQACAPAIAASPRKTLVTDIVTRWYAVRACVLCGKQIQELGGAIVPALRAAGGATRPWSDIPPEELPSLMSSAVAVCASCELAEDFRRVHPELVIERLRIEPKSERLPSPSLGVY
jgi:hypothetical protein